MKGNSERRKMMRKGGENKAKKASFCINEIESDLQDHFNGALHGSEDAIGA